MQVGIGHNQNPRGKEVWTENFRSQRQKKTQTTQSKIKESIQIFLRQIEHFHPMKKSNSELRQDIILTQKVGHMHSKYLFFKTLQSYLFVFLK